MKKPYENPALDITSIIVSEPIGSTLSGGNQNWDDLEGWGPIQPPN